MIETLKEVSKHSQESFVLVQERLLTELSLVMKGTPEYTDDAPAPFIPKKSKWVWLAWVRDRESSWQADPASVSLALHTLMVFDLPIGTLFNFVKRCVMIYVDDSDETIRGMAVQVACKVGRWNERSRSCCYRRTRLRSTARPSNRSTARCRSSFRWVFRTARRACVPVS